MVLSPHSPVPNPIIAFLVLCRCQFILVAPSEDNNLKPLKNTELNQAIMNKELVVSKILFLYLDFFSFLWASIRQIHSVKKQLLYRRLVCVCMRLSVRHLSALSLTGTDKLVYFATPDSIPGSVPAAPSHPTVNKNAD